MDFPAESDAAVRLRQTFRAYAATDISHMSRDLAPSYGTLSSTSPTHSESLAWTHGGESCA